MFDWLDISTWQVLVVDDEPDNLEVVAETLEFSGAQVKTAQNGKEAMQVLASFKPDFILTDLSMPVMDGWQLRAEIKGNAQWVGIPLLALSAHAIMGDKERALEIGFDGYITKPINIHTLPADIRSALGIGQNAAPAEKLANAVPEKAVNELPEKADDKPSSTDSTAVTGSADTRSTLGIGQNAAPTEKPANEPPEKADDKPSSTDSTAVTGLAEKDKT